METTKYTDIDKIVYNIAMLIPEQEFNAYLIKEWALEAYRLIGSKKTLISKTETIEIVNHNVILPSSIYSIEQVFYHDEQSKTFLPAYIYQGNTGLDLDLDKCITCPIMYKLNKNCLVITKKEGEIMITYLMEECENEIIDHQDLIDALKHYVLYMYYLTKLSMTDKETFQMTNTLMQFHLSMFETKKTKVKAMLNSPSIAEMENLRIAGNSFAYNRDMFKVGFNDLNKKDNMLNIWRQ